MARSWVEGALRARARLVLVGASWLALAAPAAAQEFVRGRVLVRTRNAREQLQLRFAGRTAQTSRRIAADTHVVDLPGASDAETRALAEALARDPNVVYAEPDYLRRRATGSPGSMVKPDDPMYPYQWGLPLVHAPQAWSRTTGSPEVTVALLDTGCLPHDDLRARTLPGYDFITDPVSAGDGDGRDADATDAGTASESSSAQHGVHIAGIIGASSNNTVGISGIDWGCRLLPVRVLGVERGAGVDSDIADAIRWAAGLHVDGAPDNATPAQVINMSFSGEGTSQTLQSAIDDVTAHGAVVVAAAGNLGHDARSSSPGGLRHVITVGAVDPRGRAASYSNWGPAVALMAPGGVFATDAMGRSEAILSTLGSSDYVYYAGTSQATAFVSATTALMKALSPKMTVEQVRAALLGSADPAAQCSSPGAPSEPGCGAGLLDVDAALALAQAEVATDAAGAARGCSLALARAAPGSSAWLSWLGALAFALWRSGRRVV